MPNLGIRMQMTLNIICKCLFFLFVMAVYSVLNNNMNHRVLSLILKMHLTTIICCQLLHTASTDFLGNHKSWQVSNSSVYI